MPPITIRFDEDLETWLRNKAAAEAASVSDVVRRLVNEGREREPKKLTPYEAWEQIFTGHGEPTGQVQTDRARNHKKLYREMLLAKHGRRRRPTDRSV